MSAEACGAAVAVSSIQLLAAAACSSLASALWLAGVSHSTLFFLAVLLLLAALLQAEVSLIQLAGVIASGSSLTQACLLLLVMLLELVG